MPTPVTSPGTYGNLIASASLTHGLVTAAFLDLSVVIEGQVSCEVVTGASPPTAGTIFSAYKVAPEVSPGSSNTTITTFANSTTIVVGSATGMHVGQKILVQKAGSLPQLGETTTISAIAGTTLTVGTLNNTYATNDLVFLINQTATYVVQPSSSAGTWAASKTYSTPMFLGTGQWVVEASNTDGTQAVTVAVTSDKVTGFA